MALGGPVGAIVANFIALLCAKLEITWQPSDASALRGQIAPPARLGLDISGQLGQA